MLFDAETTEATEPAEATAEAEQPDDTTEQESPNSEAAKYRKRHAMESRRGRRDTLAMIYRARKMNRSRRCSAV